MSKRLCYLIIFIFCFSTFAEDAFIKKHLMKEKINWFDRPTSESLSSASSLALLKSSYLGTLAIHPLSKVKLYDNEKLQGEPIYVSDDKGIARKGVSICTSIKEGVTMSWPVKYKIGKNGNVYKFVAGQNSIHYKEKFITSEISGEVSECAAFPFYERANGNDGSFFALYFLNKKNDVYVTQDLYGKIFYFKIDKKFIKSEYSYSKRTKKNRKCFKDITDNDVFKKKVFDLINELSPKNVRNHLFSKKLLDEKSILSFKKKIFKKYLKFYYNEEQNKEYDTPIMLCELMNKESSKEVINRFYFRNYKKPLYKQVDSTIKYTCNDSGERGVFITVHNPIKHYSTSYHYSKVEKILKLSSWPVMRSNSKYKFIFSAKDLTWFKDENNVCKEYMN